MLRFVSATKTGITFEQKKVRKKPSSKISLDFLLTLRFGQYFKLMPSWDMLEFFCFQEKQPRNVRKVLMVLSLKL